MGNNSPGRVFAAKSATRTIDELCVQGTGSKNDDGQR